MLWPAIRNAFWVLFCIWLIFQFYVFYIASPDSNGRRAVIMCLVWSVVMATFSHLRRQKRRSN